jgi:hypothetical protein
VELSSVVNCEKLDEGEFRVLEEGVGFDNDFPTNGFLL